MKSSTSDGASEQTNEENRAKPIRKLGSALSLSHNLCSTEATTRPSTRLHSFAEWTDWFNDVANCHFGAVVGFTYPGHSGFEFFSRWVLLFLFGIIYRSFLIIMHYLSISVFTAQKVKNLMHLPIRNDLKHQKLSLHIFMYGSPEANGRFNDSYESEIFLAILDVSRIWRASVAQQPSVLLGAERSRVRNSPGPTGFSLRQRN